MKYGVKFIDNFNMLKDLNNIRTRISNEFEPTQELDKYLLLEGMMNEIEKETMENINTCNIRRNSYEEISI